MRKPQASLFDQDLDARVNGEKARELHAYDVPCYWLVVSPVECQALLDGVVSTDIQKQAARLLDPNMEDEPACS